MQISYSADTMAQSYKCHCNFFQFLILLPTTSQGREESFLISHAERVNSTAVREVLFCYSFYKACKTQLTDVWTVEFLSTAIWANCPCFFAL